MTNYTLKERKNIFLYLQNTTTKTTITRLQAKQHKYMENGIRN